METNEITLILVITIMLYLFAMSCVFLIVMNELKRKINLINRQLIKTREMQEDDNFRLEVLYLNLLTISREKSLKAERYEDVRQIDWAINQIQEKRRQKEEELLKRINEH